MFSSSSKGLEWVSSYIQERSFCVPIGSSSSAVISSAYSVPQGSVLALILFTTYVSVIGRIIDSFKVRYHSCADNTQLCATLRSTPAFNFDRLLNFTTALQYWLQSNDLLLNSDKSKVAFFGTKPGLRKSGRRPFVLPDAQ